MKYILDANVGFKSVVSETDSDKAIALMDEYRQGIHELLAPDFYTAEVAHALSRAERQKRITPVEGAKLLTEILSNLPQLVPHLPFLPRAYSISSSERVGVYDCLYVAIAEKEGCELLTADDKLIKNLGGQFPFIIHLSSLP